MVIPLITDMEEQQAGLVVVPQVPRPIPTMVWRLPAVPEHLVRVTRVGGLGLTRLVGQEAAVGVKAPLVLTDRQQMAVMAALVKRPLFLDHH